MNRISDIIHFRMPFNRVGSHPETGRRTMLPGFPEEDFRTGLIGTSDCNTFIPIIALMNHTLLEFEDTKVIEYSMPISSHVYSATRQYNTLLDGLVRASRPVKFDYRLQGVSHTLYAHRGVLYSQDGKILMCLAVDRDYGFTIPISESEPNIEMDTTKFLLFMTSDFDAPEYKNVKKKLESLYVEKCKAHNIDIVYTSRVEQWLFKNNFKVPAFKSVIEMNKHLKEEVPKNLLMV